MAVLTLLVIIIKQPRFQVANWKGALLEKRRSPVQLIYQRGQRNKLEINFHDIISLIVNDCQGFRGFLKSGMPSHQIISIIFTRYCRIFDWLIIYLLKQIKLITI